MSNQNSLNAFCKYFLKYSTDYANMNGHTIGSFKTHRSTDHSTLSADNSTLSPETFCDYFYTAFETNKPDPEDVPQALFHFLNDAVNNKPKYAGVSSFDTSQLETFKNYTEKALSSYSTIQGSNPFSSRIPSTQETAEILTDLIDETSIGMIKLKAKKQLSISFS